jgi:hypothetical protein
VGCRRDGEDWISQAERRPAVCSSDRSESSSRRRGRYLNRDRMMYPNRDARCIAKECLRSEAWGPGGVSPFVWEGAGRRGSFLWHCRQRVSVRTRPGGLSGQTNAQACDRAYCTRSFLARLSGVLGAPPNPADIHVGAAPADSLWPGAEPHFATAVAAACPGVSIAACHQKSGTGGCKGRRQRWGE